MKRRQRMEIIENYAKLFKIKILSTLTLNRVADKNIEPGLNNDELFVMLAALNKKSTEMIGIYECVIARYKLNNISFLLLKAQLVEALGDLKNHNIKPISLNNILLYFDRLNRYESFIKTF